MADLTPGQHGLHVKITDQNSTTNADVESSTPLASAGGLVVREAERGQNTMSGSIPVVIASDQSAVGIEGDVAHNTIDSGNPVKMGGYAITANPTAVSNGDRANILTDDIGRLVMVNSHARDLVVKQYTQLTSTSEMTILTSGGVGVFHDLTFLALSSSANNVSVTIRDSTGGSTVWVANLDSENTMIMQFNPPIPQATADNNWTAQKSNGGSNVQVLAVAVKNI
jgi:hypothetical protein